MIGGLPAYPSSMPCRSAPDVAWIGLPAAQAADAIQACGAARVPFAVVLGAGFAETGEGGAVEQARLVESARGAGVRLLGPNTVGFVNAWDRVALTFSTVGKLDALVPGPVAVLSQSGGLGGCLLDRAAERSLGVGLFVSTGNEADLSLADYLDWLVEDGRARAIACLVEQVRDPERVRAAVGRAVARGIAVVALKLGASATGSRAARSHTGSLAGARDAWRAWARSTGLLEVTELDHLVETAAHLARAPALAGPRMAMATSSGGIAVLVADALEPRGFAFAPLGEETVRRVEALLPSLRHGGESARHHGRAARRDVRRGARHRRPGSGGRRRRRAVDIATAGGGSARAEHVIRAARGATKPLVVCWPGGTLVREGFRALDEAQVPLFTTVSSCAAALGAALAFRPLRARAPGATPAAPSVAVPAGGGALPWTSVHALLAVAGLRLAPEVIVRDREEARAAAPRLRFPVAVKALGPASPDRRRRRTARRLHSNGAGGGGRRASTARRGVPGAADGRGARGAGRRFAGSGTGRVRDGRAREASAPSSTVSAPWRRPPATRRPPSGSSPSVGRSTRCWEATEAARPRTVRVSSTRSREWRRWPPDSDRDWRPSI